MGRDLQTLSSLVEPVAQGRATLVLGPAFAHGVPALSAETLLQPFASTLSEAGWDTLDTDDQLDVAVQAIGAGPFLKQYLARTPTSDALRGAVRGFHAALIEPFRAVVDCGLHDLAEATLAQLEQPFRTVASDGDLQIPGGLPGGARLLLRLRRSPWLGDAVLTRADRLRTVTRAPRLIELLRRLGAGGPLVFYGFPPRDAWLRWLQEVVWPNASERWLIAVETNALWRRHWQDRGLEVLGGHTVGDTEALMERFLARVKTAQGRQRAETLDHVVTRASAASSEAIRALPALGWLAGDDQALEARGGDGVALAAAGLTDLNHLTERGVAVPPIFFARAARGVARLHPEAASAAIGRALAFVRRGPQPVLDGAVGLALCTLGHPQIARHHLECALDHAVIGPTPWAQLEVLGWLAHVLIEHAGALRAAGRDRAVLELLATFLARHAPRFEWARMVPTGDATSRVSRYANLRLGRVMVLAAEMAASSGAIYAEQAIDLLSRAIGLDAERPEAYRALKLLIGQGGHAPDAARWAALLRDAPPATRKRL